MLDIYTVSFFGHREVDNLFHIEDQLSELIRELLGSKEYVEFLVGRNGEFDQAASSAIKRIKRSFRDDNCCHTLVLPYATAELRENEDSFYDYYDDITICDSAQTAHFKAAIQVRNREMVDRSDLIVFYVKRKSGGAYQTFQYAVKQDKKIINFADESLFDF